jgi:hypothetical protein
MSNMHKSDDGKWRPCAAQPGNCKLKGGHVSERSIKSASHMLKTVGYSSKNLTKMSAPEIQQLDRTYSVIRSQTPAFLLESSTKEYVPPVGMVIPLEPGRGATKEGKVVSKIVREKKITATIETESTFKRERSYSRTMEDISKTLVTLDVPDSKTGDIKKVQLRVEMESSEPPRGSVSIIEGMFRSVTYYNKTGLSMNASDSAIEKYGKDNKAKVRAIKGRREKAIEARDNLVKIFGETEYKKIASSLST